MADEETPVEEADTPVEDTPAEEAAPEVDAVEAGAGDATALSDAQPDDGASGIKSPRGVARAAAVVAGAVVASAAAVVGAVWAITAITDDDDDSAVDYATSFHREDPWEDEFGWGPPGRDWGEQKERRRDARPGRDNGDRYERDQREQAESRRQERQERRELREREEREKNERTERDRQAQSKRDESANPGLPLAGDECKTILSLGTGDDAVTVLICNAPGDEWPGFERRDNGGYFKFRDLPREAFPFFGMRGEQWPFEGRPRPFGPGMAPWDRDGKPFGDDDRPFGEGWPFGRVAPWDREEPFEDGLPFDLEEFEGLFGDGLPFESDEFFERLFEEFFGGGLLFDFEGLGEDGDGGSGFRGDGGDGSENSFCFREGDEEECFSDLDELSDEEREQLERIMEMLDGFGLEGLFGGLEEFLDGLELEFGESQVEPSGVTDA